MPSDLAARLDRVVKAAGVPIVGVSIGSTTDKSTWRVVPSALQAAAAPTLAAFDPADPALDTADQDEVIKAVLDNERLISAVVWTVIDVLAPPATIAKYQNARTKIIAAYKARPWLP